MKDALHSGSNMLEQAKAFYGGELIGEVVSDYRETVGRYATPATFNRFVWEASSIYQTRDRLDGHIPSGNYNFALSILEDVAMGEGAGTIMHYERDFESLSKKLKSTLPDEDLNLASVLCPDWSWHMEGNQLIYDMDGLNGGLSKTAEKTLSYVTQIAQRADNLKRKVTYSGVFAGWELTRAEYFPYINGGVSQTEALSLLESTTGKTEELLLRLNSKYFQSTVGIAAPDSFHEEVQRKKDDILISGEYRNRLEAVLSGRQDFYKGNFTPEMAAAELAEAEIGFQLASRNHSDILVVSTSPTIARAGMTGRGVPWIQLNHGYRG